jgi:hypothetical protein
MPSTNGDPWKIRAARNQALFRAINDELRIALPADDGNTITIACECADETCVETIEVSVERYAETRSDAKRFIVLTGHVYPEVEMTVAEEPQFVVVEKIGEAAEVVAAAAGSV